MKRKQALLFLVLLTLSVGCDHATKQIALTLLEGSPTLSMAGDTLRFQLASNPGAFLSLGVGPLRSGIFNFADVSILAGAALLFWTLRHREDSEQQAA